jgi:hypothetical protein
MAHERADASFVNAELAERSASSCQAQPPGDLVPVGHVNGPAFPLERVKVDGMHRAGDTARHAIVQVRHRPDEPLLLDRREEVPSRPVARKRAEKCGVKSPSRASKMKVT